LVAATVRTAGRSHACQQTGGEQVLTPVDLLQLPRLAVAALVLLGIVIRQRRNLSRGAIDSLVFAL
jgi:hypothetical protein